MFAIIRAGLLACSLVTASLSSATAQDQHDQQQPPPQQQPQPQQPRPQPPQPGQRPPQGGAPPQFQRPAQGGTPPQYQRPAQNAAPSQPAPQFQRPTPNGAPQNAGPQFQRPAQNSAPQQQAPRANFQAAPNNVPARPNTAAGNATFAYHHFGAPPVQFSSGHFYGRDYAHFTPDDRARWQHGAWHHEFINGRYGWWYVVDDIWYFYAAPIYPYPTLVPDVVYIPDTDYDGDAYDDDADAPPPAPAGDYYYYCPDSQTYYPYVTSCASPWQQVPVAPP